MSPVFARVLRRRLICGFLLEGAFLFLLGIFAATSTEAYFTEGTWGYIAAGAWAAFLYFLAALASGFRDRFRFCLLPYFERRLNTADTFLRGRSLLANSLALDQIAGQLEVRPLSDFASGDDMAWFEKLVWHDPKEALKTVERLLNSEAAGSFSDELVSDLTHLREAIKDASSRGVRFCLLLRQGSCVSGLELDRRKGSFF